MELEEQCREEEKQHWARVAALIQVLLPSPREPTYKRSLDFYFGFQRNKAAATTYKSLDERINLVAGKVNNFDPIQLAVSQLHLNCFKMAVKISNGSVTISNGSVTIVS